MSTVNSRAFDASVWWVHIYSFSLPLREEKGVQPPLVQWGPCQNRMCSQLWLSLTFLFGCLLSFSNHVGGLKRKGAPKKKEPQKRRKVNEPEVLSEDLQVAMALSRSEMEHAAVPAALTLGTAGSERRRLTTGMCPQVAAPGEPRLPACG